MRDNRISAVATAVFLQGQRIVRQLISPSGSMGFVVGREGSTGETSMPEVRAATASQSASQKSASAGAMPSPGRVGYAVAALGGIAIAAAVVLATSPATAPRGTASEPAIQQVA